MPTISTSQVQVYNGSNDISSMVDWTTYDLTMVLTKEKGTLLFDVVVPAAPTLPANFPQLGDTLYSYYTINGGTPQKIFGGTVITLEQVVDGGIVTRYHVTAADWGYLLDSKLVKKVYANMDPADIVADIITNYCPSGFTTNHVQRGNFLVSLIQFNYQQPSKAIESLAQQIGWDWYIDPDKDLHFFFADTATGSTETNPAPFAIDDVSGNLEWSTLDATLDLSNMTNSVYVQGGTYAKAFVLDPNPSAVPPEYDPVDVYTTVAGTLAYPLIYEYEEDTMTVTLDGVGQSIGTNQVTDPSTVEVLYDTNGHFLLFTSDPGGGHALVVQGTADVPILAFLSNPASIALYGEYQTVISDTNILSVQQAQARALAQITMFGHPVYDVKFNSISPLSNLLFIGQTIMFNSAKFGVSNYPLLIRKIECVGRSPYQIEYQVEAMGSQTVTFTDMMLYLLQTSDNQTQTDSSTVLQYLLPVEEELELTDTVSVTGATGPYQWGPGTPQPRWGFFTWK